jgi:hypothetical protein
MKITLIIPDIHHKVDEAEKIIKHVGADEIIFLGDYFDDFNDDAEMVNHTCDLLEASVEQPNRIHLFGNHDIHYAYTNREFVCSGYEQWKYFIIHDHLNRKTWDKLKFYHFLDETFLLSHAGLHKSHVPANIIKLSENRKKFYSEIENHLNTEIIKGFRNESWIFHAGHSRGGNQAIGGITWCDYDKEFYPVKGLNQILGHTPQGFGKARWCHADEKDRVTVRPVDLWTPDPKTFKNTNISLNVDLDVQGNMHWAVWNGSTLTFGNVLDDM